MQQLDDVQRPIAVATARAQMQIITHWSRWVLSESSRTVDDIPFAKMRDPVRRYMTRRGFI